MQPNSVMLEGIDHMREVEAECGQERAHITAKTGHRWRWLRRPSSHLCQVGADPSAAGKKPRAQRLRHGMAGDVWADGSQCSQQGQALGVAVEERANECRAVLSPRNAEVRQERHRLPRAGAQQPPDRDHLRPAVRQKQAPTVVAMEPQAVPVGAEWACPCRLVDQRLWRCYVGIESAVNP